MSHPPPARRTSTPSGKRAIITIMQAVQFSAGLAGLARLAGAPTAGGGCTDRLVLSGSSGWCVPISCQAAIAHCTSALLQARRAAGWRTGGVGDPAVAAACGRGETGP